ncbi:MAG: M23 family metallopeptidase, partial [Bryobacteraceae bacterium]|nr:M23 family metallopeptidase [Bryobacteraceae bacterium]
LFAQTDNTLLGLMPIAANHRPGQFPIEILDSKGAVLTTQTVVIRKANFLEQNVQLTQTLQELKAAPGDAEAMRQFHAILSTDRNWFEPLSSPVPGCVVSPYGVQRLHNGKPTGNYHSGIDQRGATGTPVRAAAAGTVRLVKPLALGGNTVGVDHGQGLLSSYSHLSRFALQDGATIQKADIIGYVGSTGRSTAPHLHWTLMANGVGVNPAQWIPFTPCAVAPKPKPKKRRRS